MLIIPDLGRQRQEGQESETSLGYTVGPCLKRKKNGEKKRGRVGG